MNQFNGMTFNDFRKMQAEKKDSDRKIGILKILQDKLMEIEDLLHVSESLVEIRDAEIKELKAKLKSREEHIELLKEKIVRYEQNKEIVTNYVTQHKIRKIR